MSPILTTTAPGGGFTASHRPLPVEDLQPRLFGPEQKGDGVDVLVGAGADRGAVERRRGIVQQAQDAVAAGDRGLERFPADSPRWSAIARITRMPSVSSDR